MFREAQPELSSEGWALPQTDWLAVIIEQDNPGFTMAGPDLRPGSERPKGSTLDHDLFLLETKVPGIFAVGDVRHRSVSGAVSGIGEGSVAVEFLYQYLSRVQW